jgi:small-conductance mechanosensitive channel
VDIGEMVNIGGQVGIVSAIGMRFLVLETSHGVLVNVPTRTVTNVIAYPRGYVRLMCDVSLADDEDLRRQMIALTERLVPTVAEQFPGIMLSPASPDRVEPISQGFRQELLHGLRKFDSA